MTIPLSPGGSVPGLPAASVTTAGPSAPTNQDLEKAIHLSKSRDRRLRNLTVESDLHTSRGHMRNLTVESDLHTSRGHMRNLTVESGSGEPRMERATTHGTFEYITPHSTAHGAFHHPIHIQHQHDGPLINAASTSPIATLRTDVTLAEGATPGGVHGPARNRISDVRVSEVLRNVMAHTYSGRGGEMTPLEGRHKRNSRRWTTDRHPKLSMIASPPSRAGHMSPLFSASESRLEGRKPPVWEAEGEPDVTMRSELGRPSISLALPGLPSPSFHPTPRGSLVLGIPNVAALSALHLPDLPSPSFASNNGDFCRRHTPTNKERNSHLAAPPGGVTSPPARPSKKSVMTPTRARGESVGTNATANTLSADLLSPHDRRGAYLEYPASPGPGRSYPSLPKTPLADDNQPISPIFTRFPGQTNIRSLPSEQFDDARSPYIDASWAQPAEPAPGNVTMIRLRDQHSAASTLPSPSAFLKLHSASSFPEDQSSFPSLPPTSSAESTPVGRRQHHRGREAFNRVVEGVDHALARAGRVVEGVADRFRSSTAPSFTSKSVLAKEAEEQKRVELETPGRAPSPRRESDYRPLCPVTRPMSLGQRETGRTSQCGETSGGRAVRPRSVCLHPGHNLEPPSPEGSPDPTMRPTITGEMTVPSDTDHVPLPGSTRTYPDIPLPGTLGATTSQTAYRTGELTDVEPRNGEETECSEFGSPRRRITAPSVVVLGMADSNSSRYEMLTPVAWKNRRLTTPSIVVLQEAPPAAAQSRGRKVSFTLESVVSPTKPTDGPSANLTGQEVIGLGSVKSPDAASSSSRSGSSSRRDSLNRGFTASSSGSRRESLNFHRMSTHGNLLELPRVSIVSGPEAEYDDLPCSSDEITVDARSSSKSLVFLAGGDSQFSDEGLLEVPGAIQRSGASGSRRETLNRMWQPPKEQMDLNRSRRSIPLKNNSSYNTDEEGSGSLAIHGSGSKLAAEAEVILPDDPGPITQAIRARYKANRGESPIIARATS